MKRAPLAALLLASAALQLRAETAIDIPIPGGGSGIGFDDLVFAPALRRLLVPAGRTGNLVLVDPATRAIVAIPGFSAQSRFGGGHGEGTTSADEGRGLLFANDRSKRLLVAVDPAKRAIAASVALAAGPDYVRFVAPTGEVWVTEPGAQQIEVFSVAKDGPPAFRRSGVVRVAGGPESLAIDPERNRAYTHLWNGATVAIDLRTRTIAAQWKNGCEGSRGIALDEERGLLFAGCAEGRAVAMDLRRDGAIVSSADAPSGVDVIAWSPTLRHLYVPGAKSGKMAILAVSPEGKLATVATVATARGAHCVAADDRGGVWVCDPDRGRLLLFENPARR